MAAFVDSSAWFAAADADDADNVRMKSILGEAAPLSTSDHVIVETWRLMRSRLGRLAAERFARNALAGDLAIEVVTRADLDRALEIMESFPDQDFSLIDRTSFVVMERLGMDTVVSLDDDFAVYRYGPRRKRAFNVLR